MQRKVEYYDGKISKKEDISKILSKLNQPLVFTNMIDHWKASKWTLDEFVHLFGHMRTQFKIYYREKKHSNLLKKKPKIVENNACSSESDIVMETDCFYANATFEEFYNWLKNSESDSCGELRGYPNSSFWCYGSYKYMTELFKDNPAVLNDVDWSVFGFNGRNGHESTLWIGSDESYTPCHQDTYGSNLVAQIFGVKRWILIPPEKNVELKPTRIPYEESSVFSSVNVKSVEFQQMSYQVDLKPGEVLFVPKHWWHYVECLTPSISINSWLEQDDDDYDRMKEGLVQLLVYAFKKCDNKSMKEWLNPNQEFPEDFAECLQCIQNSCYMFDTDKRKAINIDFLINCFSEASVLDKVIEVMVKSISSNNHL